MPRRQRNPFGHLPPVRAIGRSRPRPTALFREARMNAPATAHDNPLGLDGFEFVEFTGPDPAALAALFTAMGFTHLGNHKSKNVRHYAQGDVNLILNMEPSGQAAEFRRAHGPSANG